MRPRRLLLAALLATLAAAVASCSRSSGEVGAADARTDTDGGASTRARLGSCDRVAAMSVCSEYGGGNLAQNEAVLSAGCTKLAGTFTAAECPNTAVLGACLLATGEVRKFYASGKAAYDPARAQKECEGSYRGKWSAFGGGQ
jgi:hypothetical protein